MSLLATPFAFLFFFSGFAVAQVITPGCDLTWAWVCILSFPQCVLWPSPNLLVFSSSHSILSTKIRVRLQRSCSGHALWAVSRLLVCFALHWRALSSRLFAAYTIVSLPPGNSYAGPSGVDVSNLCKCSTVGYSLMSACGGCQGGKWITYDSCCCYPLNSRDLCICI